MKRFCSAKGTIERMKRHTTVLAKHFCKRPNNGPLCKYILRTLKRQQYRNKQLNQKVSQRTAPHQRWNTDVKSYVKRCSTPHVIREFQSKIMRHHSTPIGMAKIPNTDNDKCWWGCSWVDDGESEALGLSLVSLLSLDKRFVSIYILYFSTRKDKLRGRKQDTREFRHQIELMLGKKREI